VKKLGVFFILCFFILCLFGVPVLSATTASEDYSIFENRQMASFPKFSRELLFNGQYSQAWENYLSDRIVRRNKMLSAYTALEKDILKKRVVNDVIVSENTLLPFNEYERVNDSEIAEKSAAMAKELSALNAHILKNGGKFLYVAVPEQESALKDLYPWYMNNNEEELNCIYENFFSAMEENNVPYLDMSVEFGENIADYYSKLDHHFNYRGAYFTYTKIAEELGMTPEEIIMSELPNPFFGSRNRKLYNSFESDERIIIGKAARYVRFTRTDNGKEVSPIFFAYSNTDQISPLTYAVYMGSDVAETVINTKRPRKPNILIFGDSFTNPIESMLYLNANKLYALDLRHYSEKTLFEYISTVKPDIVLCVRDDGHFTDTEGNGTFR